MGPVNASQDWKKDFQLVQTSEINPQKKVVSNKMRRDRFELLSIHHTDEFEIKKMIDRLKNRDRLRSPYLVPFEKVYHNTEQNMCGNNVKFDLVYENSETTLNDHYYHRKNKQERFSIEEVMYIIKNVCLALRDLKNMQDCHGNITMKSIITTSEVLLSDPITQQIMKEDKVRYKKTKIQGYPSPATLLSRIDSGMNVDLFKEDLFSIGIIALQLLNIETDIRSIYCSKSNSYSNAKVDYEAVYGKLDRIRAEPLKQWISILVHPNSQQRLYVYNTIESVRVPRQTLKILLDQPKSNTPEAELVEQSRPPSYEDNQYPRPNLHIPNYTAAPKMVQSEYITGFGSPPVDRRVHFVPQPPRNQSYRSQLIEPQRHQISQNQPIRFTVNNFNPPPIQSYLPQHHQPQPRQIVMQHQAIRPNPWNTFQPQIHFDGQKRQYSPFIKKEYQYSQPRFASVQKQKSLNSISFSTSPAYINPRKQFKYNSVQPVKNESNKSLSYLESLESPRIQQKVVQNKEEANGSSLISSHYVESNPVDVSKDVGVSKSSIQEKIETDTDNKNPQKTGPLFKRTESDFVSHDKIVSEKRMIKTFGSKQSVESQTKQKQIRRSSSSKSIQRKLKIEKQLAEIERLAKDNERLEKILKNGGQLEPVPQITLPIPEQAIAEAQNQDSKVEDASFMVEKYEDGSKYEGFVQDEKRNGYGKFYYQGGSVYDGEWKDNHMNGYGTLFYPQGSIAYQGNWLNDEFHGKGTLFNANVQDIRGYFDYTDFTAMEDDQWQTFEGSFAEGQRHGKGKLTLSNGQTFDGQFFEGLPEGAGIFTRSRGAKVKGVWNGGRLKTILE